MWSYWKEPTERATNMGGDWSISHMRKRWGSWDNLAWESEHISSLWSSWNISLLWGQLSIKAVCWERLWSLPFGDTQKLSEDGVGLPGLGTSAFAERLDWMISRGPSPAQPFRDSMSHEVTVAQSSYPQHCTTSMCLPSSVQICGFLLENIQFPFMAWSWNLHPKLLKMKSLIIILNICIFLTSSPRWEWTVCMLFISSSSFFSAYINCTKSPEMNMWIMVAEQNHFITTWFMAENQPNGDLCYSKIWQCCLNISRSVHHRNSLYLHMTLILLLQYLFYWNVSSSRW